MKPYLIARSAHSPRGEYPRWIAAVPVLLVCALSLQNASGQISGIGYNLTPTAERTFFDGRAGLGDALFYGGKVGFSFGEFAEMRGVFLTSGKFETDFSDFTGIDSPTDALIQSLPRRDIRMQRYGGELKFNIGRGSFFPTLSLGTGVIHFAPEGLNSSEAVYVEGGLGVQFQAAERYTVTLEARDVAYRYNPAASLMSDSDLADVGVPASDFDLQEVNNLTVSLGLQLYLGGRTRGELTDMDRALQSQFSGGLRGIALQIEPFAGQIDFKEELGFRNKQRMVGGSAGFDLGPYVGIRGFYWRAVEEGNWSNFDDLQAYGAEARFNFGDNQSLTPFLTVGGGVMDVREGYVGNGVADAEDRTFAMGGAGLVMPLGESIKIHGNIRAVVMGSEGADNISDPATVYASMMYSAGLSFGIGRKSPYAGQVMEDRVSRSDREAMLRREQVAIDLADREREIQRMEQRLDSLAKLVLVSGEGNTQALQELRSTLAARAAISADTAMTAAGGVGPSASPIIAPGSSVSNSSTASQANPGAGPAYPARPEQWVTIPVPVEGELYVRYGQPGGVTVETINGDATQVVLDPVSGRVMPVQPAREEPVAARITAQPGQSTSGTGPVGSASETAAAAPVTADEIRELVRQAIRSESSGTEAAATAGASSAASEESDMRRLERMLESRLADLERKIDARQSVVTTQAPATVVVREQPTTVVAGASTPRNVDVLPFAGFTVNRDPEFVVGVRAEVSRSNSSMRFLPEASFGFGFDKVSFSVHANIAYPVLTGAVYETRPYIGAGIGLTNMDVFEPTLNLLVGAERQFGVGDVFAEYMTMDFFDFNRLAVGYRLGF